MTVGESAMERASQQSTKNKNDHSPCVFAWGGFGDGEDRGAGFKRVFVEQDGEVVAVGVGVELVRDMRYMTTGFLEDHSMESVHRLPEGSAWGSCALRLGSTGGDA